MNQAKSRYSESLSELIHGKPNLPRSQQPDMFEIMSWGAESLCDPQLHDNTHPESYKEKELHRQSIQEQPRHNRIIQTNSSPKKQPKKVSQEEKQPIEKQTYEIPGQPNTHNQCQCCNHHQQTTKIQQCSVHGQQIKPDLYSCQKRTLRKSNSQQFKRAKVVAHYEAKKKPVTPAKRKLDDTNIVDHRIIMERIRRIKDFKMVTRDLPNSSSVTYFGKPVFQAYGRGDRGNSTAIAKIKSHNVMPHRGENHPKYDQSYYSALIKGRKVNQQCHLPRKSLVETYPDRSEQKHQEHKPINLPLETPDLVNHIIFSAEEPFKKKQSIPKQQQGNQSKRHIPKKHKAPRPKNKKLHKSQVIPSNLNDGLKYMNKRENLLELLQEKRTKQSKLAFKVTEFYPLPWNCSETCQTNPLNADWKMTRPAGKEKQETDHVADVLKQNRQLGRVCEWDCCGENCHCQNAY